MRKPSFSPSVRPGQAEIRPGLWLDSRLAVWLAAERLLLVADLHWGYAESHRARGHLLPRWGDDELATRLDSLVSDYKPAAMIWLGDIVHAAEGAASAESYLRRTNVAVTLVAGNHDRRWKFAVEPSVSRGAYFFHHGDRTLPRPPGLVEIIGHHHPAAAWGDGAGSRVKCPALVSGPNRLILPAFSPWAAGTAWNDQLAEEETLWVVAPTRVFALPRAASTRTAALS